MFLNDESILNIVYHKSFSNSIFLQILLKVSKFLPLRARPASSHGCVYYQYRLNYLIALLTAEGSMITKIVLEHRSHYGPAEHCKNAK